MEMECLNYSNQTFYNIACFLPSLEISHFLRFKNDFLSCALKVTFAVFDK